MTHLDEYQRFAIGFTVAGLALWGIVLAAAGVAVRGLVKAVNRA